MLSSTFPVPSDWEVLAREEDYVLARAPLASWIALPDHPRYVATQVRARQAHWSRAAHGAGGARALLRHVVAAFCEGVLYKVDGHTRTLLWSEGSLPAPTHVLVSIYRARSRDELNELHAATHPKLFGKESYYEPMLAAYRECGLELRSRRLKGGFIKDALNIALRGLTRPHQDKRTPEIDLYKAVRVFRKELELLDGIDPQPEIFFTGVIAAALIGLSLHPEGITFFDRLGREEGVKREGRMDPVEGVLSLIAEQRLTRRSMTRGEHEDLCARTMRAFLGYLEGEDSEQYWFKTRVRATRLQPVIAQMKRAKGIAHDPEL